MMPFIGLIGADLYWKCGACGYGIRQIRDTATAGVEYCPNFCPRCGTYVEKGGNANENADCNPVL